MSNFTMTVTPTFKRVGQAFKDIADGFKLQEELNRFAFAIERESKVKSPVDTGLMRGSITTTIGNLEARIAPHTYYAIYVHEGTWKMGARPFLKEGAEIAERSLYGSKPPFVTHIETVINDGLKGL